MPMTRGIKQMLAEANAEIETWSVEKAKAHLDDPIVTFIDIRDVRELWRDGAIPGAIHAPRGMLEFWVDPDSPYFKDFFGTGKRFVLYCAAGSRSALSTQTLKRMGLAPICHIEGGFGAWKKSGAPVEKREPEPREKT